MPPSDSQPASAVDDSAVSWLARRDRGLSAPEQAAYAQWLRADPRHEAAISRLEKVWGLLDGLAAQRPAGDATPNPDLLAPTRRRPSLWVWSPLLAAAAAVAFVYFSAAPPVVTPHVRHVIVHPGPERLTLEDGSVVELQAGAKVTAEFTAAERHVRLERGTAYFTVTKNPQRPFIVSTGQLTVRAVGTAFSVGLDARETSVLVTEGRVRVNEIPPAAAEKSAPPRELGLLGAGQQGIIAPGTAAGEAGGLGMTVTDLTPLEVERAMSWQGLRLEFVDMPLGDVAAAFNHYSRKKLVIQDAATAGILVGGNFRADNVDAFIRFLDPVFGVSAFPNGGEIILRKVRDGRGQ